MSTIDRSAPVATPPLVAGQRLDRSTFHERYERMPPNTRAELIGGVVYMPSPLSSGHGFVNTPVAYWIGHYQGATPGVGGIINASILLDDLGEPQPDTALLILPGYGGRTRDERRYVAGVPELIVEIALSSRSIDLGPKLQDYQRVGVREYVVVALEPDKVFWFVHREGRYVRLEPGEDGLLRSEVFAGLWLDARALFRYDIAQLRASLDRGLASPEHAAFVERLARARG